jgi:hemerythrin-like domain-containing protein
MGKILQFMIDDHKTIDYLWQKFISQTEDSKPNLNSFFIFKNHLFNHIQLEETVLFPLFDKFTGLESGKGPTVLLRRDHRVLQKIIRHLEKATDMQDTDKVQDLGVHFRKAFEKHTERERKMQYPVFDNFITEDEWQKILDRIYHVPVDAYTTRTM